MAKTTPQQQGFSVLFFFLVVKETCCSVILALFIHLKHTDTDQYNESDDNKNSLCAGLLLVSSFHTDPLGDSYYVAF